MGMFPCQVCEVRAMTDLGSSHCKTYLAMPGFSGQFPRFSIGRVAFSDLLLEGSDPGANVPSFSPLNGRCRNQSSLNKDPQACPGSFSLSL